VDFDPNDGSFFSDSRCLYQILSKLVKNCDRESADRQTDGDDMGDLIICPYRGFSFNMQISCFRRAKKRKRLLCIDIVICNN